MNCRSSRHHRRGGFTLIEILVVVLLLGILAAIVTPKYFNASESSRESSLRTQLQRVRTQVEFYRARMGDDPELVDNQWAELVDNDYLISEPANPLNGNETIAAAPGAGVGWVWRDKGNGTWALYATDETSMAEWSEG